MATIIISIILLAIVVAVVRSLHKDVKNGGCAGGCAGCPGCAAKGIKTCGGITPEDLERINHSKA